MTKNKHKVSVLISVFNQLHCVQKALNSALKQDYNNLEIIISDDCSTDGDVKAFLSSYGDKIKLFKNAKNLGANGNYRKLLQEYATGDYAVILNADDYWTDKKFISKAINIFDNNPEVSLVFGDVFVYLENTNSFIKDSMNKSLPAIIDGNEFFINFPKGYSLPHLACLYSRKKALALDFYKSDLVSSDWESLLKLSLKNKVGYIKNEVGVLTRNNNNYTKDADIKGLIAADGYLHNLKKYAEKSTVFTSQELENWLSKMLYRHHTKWFVKLNYLNLEILEEYKAFVKKSYPNIYQSITKNYKYKLFLIIKEKPIILRFIFKHFLKQESFISDLLAFQNKNNEL